jgi:hypothetical protein
MDGKIVAIVNFATNPMNPPVTSFSFAASQEEFGQT